MNKTLLIKQAVVFFAAVTAVITYLTLVSKYDVPMWKAFPLIIVLVWAQIWLYTSGRQETERVKKAASVSENAAFENRETIRDEQRVAGEAAGEAHSRSGEVSSKESR
jgi:hypothetical protein